MREMTAAILRSCFTPALILVLGGAVYYNSLPNPFVFDDLEFIVDNPDIRSLWPPDWARASDLPHASLNGRPLISLSLALNFALGELQVRGYRLVNIAAHLASTLALFGLLKRLLRQGWAQARFGARTAPYLAAAVSLLWMVHPLHTECINYISQRSESIMGFCYFMTFYCLLRGTETNRVGWYVGAVIICSLGMMSKEVMATVPLLALLFDRTFVAGRFGLALRRRWGCYLGLAFGWFVLARQLWSEPHIGMIGFSALSPWEYALNQCPVLVRYLTVVFWPHRLLLDYGPPLPLSLAAVFPQAILVVALLGATIAALRLWPRAGFLGAWCFVILAPTSSFLPILTEVGAERRLYLPSAGLVALGSLLIAAVLHRRDSLRTGNLWMAGVGGSLFALAFAAGALETVERNREYASALSIWQTVVDRAPENHRGLNNLGVELASAGQLDRAIEHYHKAIHIYPGYADARINLGNALTIRGHWALAIEQFHFALEVNPEVAELHYNLGRALAASDQTVQAIVHYREALRLDPKYAKAYNNLGAAYLSTDQIELAMEQFRAAVRIHPDFAGPYFNLGIALEIQGRLEAALEQYERARALAPGRKDWEENLDRLRGELESGSGDIAR
jgi:tetratricopeptide (TPR) repeat protein